MEFRENIDKKVLDDFVIHHENGHYGKTSMWAQVKQFQEKCDPLYTGLYEEGRLIASAMILLYKKWGVSYAYIPWGICMDYNDTNALQAYSHALRQFAQKRRLSFIKMDPNVSHLDSKGNPDETITKALQAVGWTHKGYGYGYDGSWSNRYTLMIDLSEDYDTIKKRFSPARRSAIKKHNVYSITTRKAGADELDTLCRLEKILAEEKGFAPHREEFFRNIMESFPHNHVYAISTLHIDESIEKIEAELSSKKYAKDPEARAAKEKSRGELWKLKEKYGSEVEIAAGLFLYAGKTSWDLYLYKCSDFNFINGTDEIHQFMIQTMKENGVLRYDMCGFSGSTDPKDPYYGLYLYKSSFGSKIVEHLGEFNLIINSKKTQRFNKTDRMYRKVRRKLGYLKNHRKSA